MQCRRRTASKEMAADWEKGKVPSVGWRWMMVGAVLRGIVSKGSWGRWKGCEEEKFKV